MPTVSIIIPTYNHERYIARCLESVRSQTRQDWEAIVIDDFSSDGTPRIAESFTGRDTRFRFVRHSANYGIFQLNRTYNEGLQLTQGEFVAVLEGDDFWLPRRLELQVPSFTSPDVVASHGLFEIVASDSTGREKRRAVPYPFRKDVRTNTPVGSALKALLLGANPLRAQTVMVRRSALEKMGGYQQPPFWCLADYPTWMRLAMVGRFAFVNEKLGYWRRHAAAVLLVRKEEMLRGFLRYVKDFADTHRADMTRLMPGLEPFIERQGLVTLAYLCRHCLAEGRWKDALSPATRVAETGGILSSLRGIYDLREYWRAKWPELTNPFA